MTIASFIGFLFVAGLITFGFIGNYRAGKWKDKQDEIYRKESEGHGGR